jgi:hypothetical protein
LVWPAISKGIEIICHGKTKNIVCLSEKACWSPHQSGFRSKHIAPIESYERYTTGLRGETSFPLILLDFSKTFDSMDHYHFYVPNGLTNINSRPILRTSSDLTLVIELISAYGLIDIAFTHHRLSAGLCTETAAILIIHHNDITLEIQTCRYHLYADDVQLYISFVFHRSMLLA